MPELPGGGDGLLLSVWPPNSIFGPLSNVNLHAPDYLSSSVSDRGYPACQPSGSSPPPPPLLLNTTENNNSSANKNYSVAASISSTSTSTSATTSSAMNFTTTTTNNNGTLLWGNEQNRPPDSNGNSNNLQAIMHESNMWSNDIYHAMQQSSQQQTPASKSVSSSHFSPTSCWSPTNSASPTSLVKPTSAMTADCLGGWPNSSLWSPPPHHHHGQSLYDAAGRWSDGTTGTGGGCVGGPTGPQQNFVVDSAKRSLFDHNHAGSGSGSESSTSPCSAGGPPAVLPVSVPPMPQQQQQLRRSQCSTSSGSSQESTPSKSWPTNQHQPHSLLPPPPPPTHHHPHHLGGKPAPLRPMTRTVFAEPGSGMRDVPQWLKSLRLHKYTALFQHMDYESMLALTDQHLERQGVTKGARKKLIFSVQKLKDRYQTLRALERDAAEPSCVRNTLAELKLILVSPIRQYPLPGRPEPVQSRIDGLNIPIEEIDADNLPAVFTRVLGKAHATLLAVPELILHEETYGTLMFVLERGIAHEAFTLAQKRRLIGWKHAVNKTVSKLAGLNVAQSRRNLQQLGMPPPPPPGGPLAPRNGCGPTALGSTRWNAGLLGRGPPPPLSATPAALPGGVWTPNEQWAAAAAGNASRLCAGAGSRTGPRADTSDATVAWLQQQMAAYTADCAPPWTPPSQQQQQQQQPVPTSHPAANPPNQPHHPLAAGVQRPPPPPPPAHGVSHQSPPPPPQLLQLIAHVQHQQQQQQQHLAHFVHNLLSSLDAQQLANLAHVATGAGLLSSSAAVEQPPPARLATATTPGLPPPPPPPQQQQQQQSTGHHSPPATAGLWPTNDGRLLHAPAASAGDVGHTTWNLQSGWGGSTANNNNISSSQPQHEPTTAGGGADKTDCHDLTLDALCRSVTDMVIGCQQQQQQGTGGVGSCERA